MRPFLIILICLISYCASGQSPTYDLSDKVDIAQRGWNKVLLMRNGNTLLFHFEPRKGIVVKVFDKDHKEIASRKHTCKILDVNKLDNTRVKGISDINGVAVLFFEQMNNRKNALIRLSVDARTGDLTDEQMMLQSKSFAEQTKYYVMINNDADEYYVLCSPNIATHPKAKIEVLSYNKDRQQTGQRVLNIDTKDISYIDVLGAQYLEGQGVCISFSTGKQLTLGNDPLYERHLEICYAGHGADTFSTTRIRLDSTLVPIYTRAAYNRINNSLNILLAERAVDYVRSGLQEDEIVYRYAALIQLDERKMNYHYRWLNNELINKKIKRIDANYTFTGVPRALLASNDGTLVAVCEDSWNQGLYNAGLTWLASDGTETNGILCLKGAGTASHGEVNGNKYLFGKTEPEIYRGQFTSFDCRYNEKGIYLIYNDLPLNFSRTINEGYDSVADYGRASGFYYAASWQGEVRKMRLFETDTPNAPEAILLESADFNEQRNIYAALVLYKDDERTDLKMAWCHLE